MNLFGQATIMLAESTSGVFLRGRMDKVKVVHVSVDVAGTVITYRVGETETHVAGFNAAGQLKFDMTL